MQVVTGVNTGPIDKANDDGDDNWRPAALQMPGCRWHLRSYLFLNEMMTLRMLVVGVACWHPMSTGSDRSRLCSLAGEGNVSFGCVA